MWRRRGIDIKNGIILTLLIFVIILYSTSSSQLQVPAQHFSPAQKIFDTTYSESNTNPPQLADIPGSVISASVRKAPVYESETTYPDGVVAYTRTTALAANSTLLFLTLTKDATSWGRDVDAPLRTFHDYLDVLLSTELDLSLTSLSLWTSSLSQYNLFRTATTRIPFARLIIHLDPSADPSTREQRHSTENQSTRRSRVARLRNNLLLRSLGPEPHHLWLDADVSALSRGIIQRMLSHSARNPDAGIITARCEEGPTWNYDKNAWAGFRPGPPGSESSDSDIVEWEERQKYLTVPKLLRGTGDEDLIPLEAVGGTILYMRAQLVWEGLNFPSWHVVGTRWGRDGWDGIETEGVCYAARRLAGGKCWLLGGRNHVQHTNL